MIRRTSPKTNILCTEFHKLIWVLVTITNASLSQFLANSLNLCTFITRFKMKKDGSHLIMFWVNKGLYTSHYPFLSHKCPNQEWRWSPKKTVIQQWLCEIEIEKPMDRKVYTTASSSYRKIQFYWFKVAKWASHLRLGLIVTLTNLTVSVKGSEQDYLTSKNAANMDE